MYLRTIRYIAIGALTAVYVFCIYVLGVHRSDVTIAVAGVMALALGCGAALAVARAGGLSLPARKMWAGGAVVAGAPLCFAVAHLVRGDPSSATRDVVAAIVGAAFIAVASFVAPARQAPLGSGHSGTVK